MDWLSMLGGGSPGQGAQGGQQGPDPRMDALMQLLGQVRQPQQAGEPQQQLPQQLPIPQGQQPVAGIDQNQLGALAALLMKALQAGVAQEPDRLKKENRFQELVGKS